MGWTPAYDLAEIDGAPRFRNASLDFVKDNADPTVQKILKELIELSAVQELLTDKDLDCRVSVGIHVLNTGECANVPRWMSELLPDAGYLDPHLAKLEPYNKSRTVRVILSDSTAGVATPLIAVNKVTLLAKPKGELWNELNLMLGAHAQTEPMQSRLLMDREIVSYSNMTLLKEMKAHRPGMRLDVRMQFSQFDTVPNDRKIMTSQIYLIPKLSLVSPIQ